MPNSTIHGLPLMGTVNPATDEFAIWDAANQTTKRISVTDALIAANPYVTIYSGATVTPQASGWTIVDGRVNQVGLDVQATTGVTSITTGTGLTLDGSFDLEPIGDTLSTFSSTNCAFDVFSPGTLANLSTLEFDDCTFTSIDVTQCQNQLVLNLTGCVCPTLITQNTEVLYSIVIFGGTYGNLNFNGCPLLTSVTVAGFLGLNIKPIVVGSITITNSTTLTSVNLAGSGGTFPSDSYGTVSITGCTSLTSVDLGGAKITSTDLSNCTALTSLTCSVYASGASLNLTGCSGLASFTFGISTLQSINLTGCTSLVSVDSVDVQYLETVTVSTLPSMTNLILHNGDTGVGAALNVASVNAILVALNANGLSNGTVDLSGGTSAAPTGAGATAKTSLIGKGWSVTTN